MTTSARTLASFSSCWKRQLAAVAVGLAAAAAAPSVAQAQHSVTPMPTTAWVPQCADFLNALAPTPQVTFPSNWLVGSHQIAMPPSPGIQWPVGIPPMFHCFNLVWFSAHSFFFAQVTPVWNGITIDVSRGQVQAGWDCNHSSITYGVFRKNLSLPWEYVGGAELHGEIVDGVCRYTSTAFASWGPTTMNIPVPNFAWEYRIGIMAWSHNDPALSHMGTDCSTLSCYWPSTLNIFGS
jgi:hypothetical protein